MLVLLGSDIVALRLHFAPAKKKRKSSRANDERWLIHQLDRKTMQPRSVYTRLKGSANTETDIL